MGWFEFGAMTYVSIESDNLVGAQKVVEFEYSDFSESLLLTYSLSECV